MYASCETCQTLLGALCEAATRLTVAGIHVHDVSGHGNADLFEECVGLGEDRVVSLGAIKRPGGVCAVRKAEWLPDAHDALHLREFLPRYIKIRKSHGIYVS
jgi:hypothetical protein